VALFYMTILMVAIDLMMALFYMTILMVAIDLMMGVI